MEKEFDEYIVHWEGDDYDLWDDGYKFLESYDTSNKKRIGFWVKNYKNS
jgi:hypothetical protein